MTKKKDIERFFAADVEKITGVKRQRLEQWLERGFIAPSIQAASGHGSRNIWSRDDLHTIARFKKMIESGLSRKLAGDCLLSGIETSEKIMRLLEKSRDASKKE